MPKTRLAAPTGRYAFYTKPRTCTRGIVDTQQRPAQYETGLYEVNGSLVEGFQERGGSIIVDGARVRRYSVVGKVIR